MSGWGKKNRRYKKTEEKILAVFFDNPNCTMQKLAKRAGVARSTIYMHHCSHKMIVSDCEKYILLEFNNILNSKKQIKAIYLDILIFIIKNRKIFEIFLKSKDRDIIMKMVLELKPKIKEPERIFRVYVSEVAEVIFEWGERGFSEKEMEKVLGDIMYLTKTARERLAPLI